MIEARVTGVADLRRELAALPNKLRVRAVRNALAAGARLVRNAARSAAPVLSIGDPAVQAGRRKPGTVRKAISVRTSKTARAAGNVGVFVNVRPAKGARFKTTTSNLLGLKIRTKRLTRASQRGAKSPNDPFYWRFVAFGTRNMGPRNFLEAGAARLPQALAVFLAKIGPAIAKLNRPKAPAP